MHSYTVINTSGWGIVGVINRWSEQVSIIGVQSEVGRDGLEWLGGCEEFLRINKPSGGSGGDKQMARTGVHRCTVRKWKGGDYGIYGIYGIFMGAINQSKVTHCPLHSLWCRWEAKSKYWSELTDCLLVTHCCILSPLRRGVRTHTQAETMKWTAYSSTFGTLYE